MVHSSEAITAKHSTFTSDNLNNTIQGAKTKYLDSISITINGLQNGSTAVTQANIMGLVDRLTFSTSGVIGIDCSLLDIYALNQLWLGNNTYTKAGAGDDQEWITAGLTMPIWQPAVNLESQLSAYYSAVTNSDSTEISLTANFLQGMPTHSTLHYTKFTQNTSGVDDTTLNNWSHELNSTIGKISGILLNSPTIAGGSTLIEDGSIQQIAVDIDGQDQVLMYEWHELPSLQNNSHGQLYSALRDDPATIALLDNYSWIPLGYEPIPQGSNVKIKAMAGVNASAVSDVVIQQIPY